MTIPRKCQISVLREYLWTVGVVLTLAVSAKSLVMNSSGTPRKCSLILWCMSYKNETAGHENICPQALTHWKQDFLLREASALYLPTRWMWGNTWRFDLPPARDGERREQETASMLFSSTQWTLGQLKPSSAAMNFPDGLFPVAITKRKTIHNLSRRLTILPPISFFGGSRGIIL